MSKPPKPKYRTTNWSAYNESLCQRGALLLWIDKDMEWAGLPSGKRGRSPSFSDAAVQFCLMIKNLYGLALRQTTGMVRSLLKRAELGWEVPDFSTLSRRQKHLQVTLTHQLRCSTVSPSLARLKPYAWHKSIWGQGNCDLASIYATKPTRTINLEHSQQKERFFYVKNSLLDNYQTPSGS